jgi:hypothetical protein
MMTDHVAKHGPWEGINVFVTEMAMPTNNANQGKAKRWRTKESGGHSGALMNNDCEACSSAQDHRSRPISSEYLPRIKYQAVNGKVMLSICWLPR